MRKIYLVMETREHPYLSGDNDSGYAIRAFKTRKKAEKFLNEYVDNFLAEYKENMGVSMFDVKPRSVDHIFICDAQLSLWEKIMPERMIEDRPLTLDEKYMFRKRYFIREIDLDLEIR